MVCVFFCIRFCDVDFKGFYYCNGYVNVELRNGFFINKFESNWLFGVRSSYED